MNFVWLILIYSCCVMHSLIAINRSDLIAINKIESEIRVLLDKKPIDWQQQVQMRINQLERQYIPKGYQREKLIAFKKALKPEIPVIFAAPTSIQPHIIVEEPKITMTELSTIVQKEPPPTVITELPTIVQEEPIITEEVVVAEQPAITIEQPKIITEYPQKIITKPKPIVEPIKTIPKVVPQEPILRKEIKEEQEVKKDLSEKSVEKIIKKLDELLQIPIADRSENWKSIVNKYIFTLALTDSEKAKEYFEKVYLPLQVIEKKQIQEQEIIQQPQEQIIQKPEIIEISPVYIQEKVQEIDKKQKIETIINQLNDLLALPLIQKDAAWERSVNELIFELSLYDKEKANEYLFKIYVRAGKEQIPSISPLPLLPKPGGPPPPPMPSAGLPKPGGPPAPPMPTGGPKVPPIPSGIKQPQRAPVITLGSLRKMDDATLLALFNKHLDELEKNWNELSNEIVKVKTTYGTKTEMIRGVPELAWVNTLNTIKKVIIEKNIMPESEVNKKIEDRIAFVRAEKIKIASQRPVKEEKVSEEITQQDLEQQLKLLFSNPQTTQMSWLVGVKSAIKKLDAFDHNAALKYQEEYIQLMPKEKRFIKP